MSFPPTPKRRYTSLTRTESPFSPKKIKARSVNQLLGKDIENIKVSNAQFEKVKLAELLCSVLAVSGFACAAIAYDISYSQSVYEDAETETDYLLWACTVTTIILEISIFWRTLCVLKWYKTKAFYSQIDNLYTTGMYRPLVLELIINAIHPWQELIYFNDTRNTANAHLEYSHVAIFSVFMLVRIYHLIRLATILGPFRNSASQRLCRIYGNRAGISYSLKCTVRQYPYSTIAVTLIAGIGVFAYCMRIFEREISSGGDRELGDYENALWNIVITMTTVGYGEFFPRTDYGRVVGFIACIYGVFVVSLGVVTITEQLEHDPTEEKSLLQLHRLQFKHELRVGAARLISAFFGFLYVRNNFPDEEKKLMLKREIYWKRLGDFKALKNREKGLYGDNTVMDRIERKLIKVDGQMDLIVEVTTMINRVIDEIEEEENNS